MRISRLLFLMLVALGLSGVARAQSLTTFGFSLGYEFGVPLDISRDTGTTNPLAFPITGASHSHTLWLGGLYTWSEVLSDVNLRASAQYGFSLGFFNSDLYIDDSGVTFGDAEIEAVEKQLLVRSTTHLASFQAMLDWQPGSNWNLGFGVWANSLLASTFSRKEQILNARSEIRFERERGKERDLYPEQVPTFNDFRWGPTVSMSWKLDGGMNLDIRPEVFGKLDMTSAGDLGLRAFSGGLRFNFLLNPESVDRELQTAASSDARKELPALTAAVRITSNGVSLDAPVTAQPHSVLHRKFESVLPFIEIPTVNDRERVSIMIDALGKRLAETPGSITLIPSAQESILEMAGRELRDSIRDAASRYQASTPQVNVQPAQRNRSTEHLPSGLLVSTDQQTLLRPVADQWIESRYQLPPITIERYTDSRAGIKSWNVIVRQGRRTLARYSNLEGGNAELESGLFLTQDDNAVIAPILAEMTITDLAEQTMTVYDTLHLTKGVADASHADSTVYEYLFYSSGNNPGAFDVLNVSKKLLLKTLRDQLVSTNNIEIQYSNGSMNLASELLSEISRIVAETGSNSEIRMRLVKGLSSPRTIQMVKVLQLN